MSCSFFLGWVVSTKRSRASKKNRILRRFIGQSTLNWRTESQFLCHCNRNGAMKNWAGYGDDDCFLFAQKGFLSLLFIPLQAKMKSIKAWEEKRVYTVHAAEQKENKVAAIWDRGTKKDLRADFSLPFCASIVTFLSHHRGSSCLYSDTVECQLSYALKLICSFTDPIHPYKTMQVSPK